MTLILHTIVLSLHIVNCSVGAIIHGHYLSSSLFTFQAWEPRVLMCLGVGLRNFLSQCSRALIIWQPISMTALSVCVCFGENQTLARFKGFAV